MTIEVLIGVFIIAIAIFVAFYVVTSRRIKKRSENFAKNHDQIMDLDQKIKNELSRTKKISKNEESIKLFDEWLKEYEHFKGEIDIIDQLTNRVKKTNTFATRKDFAGYAAELNVHLEGFEDRLLILYNKINKYTSYELENTRISLELKERIKDLINEFDAKLRYLEIYSQSFDNQIENVNQDINNFEQLQREGEYPKGRDILKNSARTIDNIDYVLSLIIDLQAHINNLNTQITKIETINSKITKLNFSINLKDFDSRIEKFKLETNNLLNEVTYIDFNQEVDKTHLREIKVKLKTLDEDITEYKSIVEEKSTYIYEIIEYLNNNNLLIEHSEEILQGAFEEKEKIVKLYEINDIEQHVNKIDEQIEQYNNFKNDYVNLLEIIYEGKEDYANLKSRIIKANKYLNRVLSNTKDVLIALKEIRTDELRAHEMVSQHQKSIIEIDLYLRSYNHQNSVSNNLRNILTDIDVKLDKLQEELDKEPLNITNVRNLNTSVSKLINEVTEVKAHENIKQREAARYLILYFNRFTHTQDGVNYTRHFNALFNENDYKRILKEAYELLQSSNKDGDQIYKRVVNQVHVEPFTKIF